MCVCVFTGTHTHIHIYTHIHTHTSTYSTEPNRSSKSLHVPHDIIKAQVGQLPQIYKHIYMYHVHIYMYVCILTRRHTTLTYIMIDFVFPTKKTRVSIADRSRFDLSVFVQKSTNTVFLLLKKGHFVSESVIHVCVCHMRVTYVCTYDIT